MFGIVEVKKMTIFVVRVVAAQVEAVCVYEVFSVFADR